MIDPSANFFDTIPARYAEDIAGRLRALDSRSQGDYAYRVENRGLPMPIWAARGLPDDGSHAWSILQAELQTAPIERPICIYVHVPFCDSHCDFCDCYAFALRQQRQIHTQSYTSHLLTEIGLWAGQGNLAGRPVTSVHLGGGTPTLLGRPNLERLTATLRERFAVDANTEWALETTSSSLDAPTFAVLHDLGYRRLHIGVQSLQDEVRKAIGRRESGADVIGKIEKALSLGWIVSVDLIVGLPAQTPQGLLADLDRLVAAGVEGFSIYELQHSDRNQRFFEQHGLLNVPAINRYLFFQLAFQHLEAQGYAKNVFNHLAKGRDLNLYFTFPQRDEDLLALGTIADGVFGSYHYRHPEYLPYTHRVSDQNPGLQGGLRRTPLEDAWHRLEVQIMSGQIDPDVFKQILGERAAAGLIRRWRSHRMIVENDRGDGFVLSPNGAWFAGQLLHEIQPKPVSCPAETTG
jgi:oxygen-independent coproporphyrinogen-3 oxidase